MMQTAKREKTEQRCLVTALVFNAVFLALALLLYQIGFESNDDLTLAAFVDGQMAVPTAHIPYINIVLGVLLKGIYTVLGRGVAWHTLCQMLLLCLAGIFLYITNGYQAQVEMMQETELEAELKDWRYRSITRVSELTLLCRQSQLERRLREQGDSTLLPSKVAPFIIKE